MGSDIQAEQFVRRTTVPSATRLVPEIRLHLADDAIDLWELTEAASGRVGLDPPFWAFAWAGGQALARYVLDHPAVVAGRAVLDLAAGGGIVAIAAAVAGAASVTATEIDRLAVAAIRVNAALNGVAVDAVDDDVLGADGGGADVVLAGDVFYERGMSARVLPLLRRVRAGGGEVLVGDPGRAYLPATGLEALARYDVPVPLELEDAEVKRTTVWRLR